MQEALKLLKEIEVNEKALRNERILRRNLEEKFGFFQQILQK